MDVSSGDINDYIKRAAGEAFSAKDFRTWSATVLAAVGLACGDDTVKAASEGAAGRMLRSRVNRVVREVADAIGDTPAVCRSAYIDPAVVDRFEQGRTVGAALGSAARRSNGRASAKARHATEKAVLRLLSR